MRVWVQLAEEPGRDERHSGKGWQKSPHGMSAVLRETGKQPERDATFFKRSNIMYCIAFEGHAIYHYKHQYLNYISCNFQPLTSFGAPAVADFVREEPPATSIFSASPNNGLCNGLVFAPN